MITITVHPQANAPLAGLVGRMPCGGISQTCAQDAGRSSLRASRACSDSRQRRFPHPRCTGTRSPSQGPGDGGGGGSREAVHGQAAGVQRRRRRLSSPGSRFSPCRFCPCPVPGSHPPRGESSPSKQPQQPRMQGRHRSPRPPAADRELLGPRRAADSPERLMQTPPRRLQEAGKGGGAEGAAPPRPSSNAESLRLTPGVPAAQSRGTRLEQRVPAKSGARLPGQALPPPAAPSPLGRFGLRKRPNRVRPG